MRLLRHASVVFVLVCLTLMPMRAEASSIIDPTGFTFDGLVNDYNFTGELGAFNDEYWFKLDVQIELLLMAHTTSYGSGTGFDPVLTLLNEQKALLTDNDSSPDDPTDLDAQITWLLAPGTYWLVVTQAPNYYEDFDGVLRFGYALARCSDPEVEFVYADACNSPFGNRDGTFAGFLSAEPTTPVPEPGSVVLVGIGVLTLAGRRWLRRMV